LQLKDLFGKDTGLDERSYDSLLAALEKANLPGFDYLEFKQSLGALEKMGMDENTAVRSAYTTAATMGLTKEKLISSARHYKTVLNNELVQFDKACTGQIERRVTGKKKEVELLKKKIEEYRMEISRLEMKIAENQRIIDSADADIEEAGEKIQSAKIAFDRTFQSVMNQIEKDISIIDQIL
jgi:peptidoglycan hydrolase CwlO-like protein